MPKALCSTDTQNNRTVASSFPAREKPSRSSTSGRLYACTYHTRNICRNRTIPSTPRTPVRQTLWPGRRGRRWRSVACYAYMGGSFRTPRTRPRVCRSEACSVSSVFLLLLAPLHCSQLPSHSSPALTSSHSSQLPLRCSHLSSHSSQLPLHCSQLSPQLPRPRLPSPRVRRSRLSPQQSACDAWR